MKTEFSIRLDVSSLIGEKQAILKFIQKETKLSSKMVNKCNKELQIINIKIACLVNVING